MSNAFFDIAAVDYDNAFTNSQIGKLQRNLVQDYLTDILPKNKALNILEINCGTGEDAIWLAKQGHQVTATDISGQMIQIAKAKQFNLDTLQFEQLDINDLDKTVFSQTFDLIFSDFGGLNCLSPEQLHDFLLAAHTKLNSKGSLIAVIMPKHCLLESLYFLLKGSFKKAFRRYTKKSVDANVDGTLVPTWYFNPHEILKMGKTLFSKTLQLPIGFLIPPSYLEPFFENKKHLLNRLSKIDKFFKKTNGLAKYSDHYLIHLTKK